jgi:hypothetical protein
MPPEKHTPDLEEGSTAFDRFRDAVKSVLSVRKSELPARPSRKRKRRPKRAKA